MKRLLLLVAALACASGCQKERKKPEQAKDTRPSEPQLPKELPATDNPLAGNRGAAFELLRYLPRDSSVIVGFSASKANKSQLFKKYQDKLLDGAAESMAEVKEKCGIDMMSEMRELVVAFSEDLQKSESTVIAVRGYYDRNKIEACVVKMGGTIEGTAMTSPDGRVNNMIWVGGDTVLFSQGRSADELRAATGAGSVTQNKDLMELIGKVDSSATVWAAGFFPPETAGMLGGMGAPPKSGYLGVNLGIALDATAGLIFETLDDAKSTSSMIEMGLDMGRQQEGMAEVLRDASSSLSGNTVTINAKMTGAQVDQLMSMTSGAF